MKNVLFVSLGCDKNLVDSEKMLGLLNEAGYRVAQEESEADDTEVVAVIAAAIAASQGATSTDGFVVRSIRKVR